MPFVQAGNARVHYTREGDGPPLMLLHGTGGDGFSHWGQLTRHLTPGRQVLCPDYAGSGRTEDDGGTLTLDTLVDQMLAVLDAEGLACVDLAGYSLGAVIAAALAARHPRRVRRLVLVAGFAGGEDSRAHLQFGLWRDLIAHDRALMARFILLTGCSPAWLAAQSQAQIDKRVTAILRFTNWEGMARQTALDSLLDIRTELSAITAPTLVIAGDGDQMVPGQLTDALAAGITGSRQLGLPGGHLLPMEQPEALARAILGFVDAG